MSDVWTLRRGDSFQLLPGVPEGSVDAVVTDPPYGLKLYKQGFDDLGPREAQVLWHRTWAEMALRALKPGGHLVAFGAPRTYHLLTYGLDQANFELRDSLMWLYGTGRAKNLDIAQAIDAHVLTGKSNSTTRAKAGSELKTEEARRWKGWGTALKPGYEPIVLVRKPFPGSTAENILAGNLGAINIDATLLERGSWPANVLIDEEAGSFLDEQTGPLWKSSGGGMKRDGKREGVYGISGHEQVQRVGFGDEGGPSRFFYCAKPSAEERAGNKHPTVKPIALMRWLCRLVTPLGGLILDPFAGSGSTGVGALREGFRFIGMEKDAEWMEIANTRLLKEAA